MGVAGVGAVASYLTLGVVFSAPVALAAGAAGAVYVSTTKTNTVAGKAVKQAGEITAETVVKISHEAKSVDEKHGENLNRA